MNILSIAQRFPTQESCIEHLERIKWNGKPQCPYCNSEKVARKTEALHVGRWNCHNCLSTFKVLSGTIFQGTKIPLQKWFAAIAILLNAKKSVSSYQLARDLDLNQKTAWYIATRIRKAMTGDSALLRGIVEADETYLGGKPRHKGQSKPGRGTNKLPILGAVERDGKVIAAKMEHLSAGKIKNFLMAHVNRDAMLITDQYRAYAPMDYVLDRKTINHSVEYVNGILHTNTIEGFWALLKRALTGQHHHYTVEHAAMYIDEACYKYNNRKSETPWDDFMQRAMGVA